MLSHCVCVCVAAIILFVYLDPAYATSVNLGDEIIIKQAVLHNIYFLLIFILYSVFVIFVSSLDCHDLKHKLIILWFYW